MKHQFSSQRRQAEEAEERMMVEKNVGRSFLLQSWLCTYWLQDLEQTKPPFWARVISSMKWGVGTKCLSEPLLCQSPWLTELLRPHAAFGKHNFPDAWCTYISWILQMILESILVYDHLAVWPLEGQIFEYVWRNKQAWRVKSNKPDRGSYDKLRTSI